MFGKKKKKKGKDKQEEVVIEAAEPVQATPAKAETPAPKPAPAAPARSAEPAPQPAAATPQAHSEATGADPVAPQHIGPPSDVPTGWADLNRVALGHCKTLQATHNQSWQMNKANSWGCNLDKGLIQWKIGDYVASAPVELLGTWNPADKSFLWGWAHPNLTEEKAVASTKVRRFAQENQIGELLNPKPQCPNDACWQLVAPVTVIAGLQGVYRAETAPGKSWAYFGFGEVSISKEPGAELASA